MSGQVRRPIDVRAQGPRVSSKKNKMILKNFASCARIYRVGKLFCGWLNARAFGTCSTCSRMSSRSPMVATARAASGRTPTCATTSARTAATSSSREPRHARHAASSRRCLALSGNLRSISRTRLHWDIVSRAASRRALLTFMKNRKRKLVGASTPNAHVRTR